MENPQKNDPTIQASSGEIITNIKDATNARMKEVFMSNKYLIPAIIAVWLFFIVLSVKAGAGDLLGFVIFIPIGILGAIFAYYKNKFRHIFMEQTALSLGFTYSRTGNTFGRHASLLKVGHNQRVSDVISGKINGNTQDIFTFNTTIGSGKNKRTITATVLQVNFDKLLPHMYLLPKGFNFGLWLTPNWENSDKLSMEGNFNDSYTVHCEKEFEIEVLQVLSPDLLHKFLNEWKGLALELVNQQAFVFMSKELYDIKELKIMQDVGRQLIERLNEIRTTHLDEMREKVK